MSSAEGINALDQILASEMLPGIIVKRGDLPGKPAAPLANAPKPASTASPEGEIESVLEDWWQELLGVEKVGLDDDFFDLGGHSLIGVRLFAKIKKAYQVDLDLAVLFEARNVRQLAGVIRKLKQPATSEARTWSALVPIQPNGSRIPIFCVHALGTSLLFYRQLAAHLGNDQPFYALQSPLESQDQIKDPTLEELASIYLKELQAFFPQGPYILGGASLGGIIALEMCQQLKAQGKDPRLLILFDAAVPGCDYQVPARDQISRHWQKIREEGPAYLLRRLMVKGEYWHFVVNRSARTLGCFFYRLLGRELPASLHYFQVEQAHKRALNRYAVRFYPGKITLMRAADIEETAGTRRNPTLGWQNLAGGGLEIHDVPGGHISMFEEPNVRTLAEELKVLLPLSSAAPVVR
jgi:thioesterase domain-containing protein/acyl carrier protein